MTQELIDKLINHYEDAISKINKIDNIEEIKKFIDEKEIDYGICRCSCEIFNENIYTNKWISSKCNNSGYIAKRPSLSSLKDEIIKLLQIRVDIMKQFPN